MDLLCMGLAGQVASKCQQKKLKKLAEDCGSLGQFNHFSRLLRLVPGKDGSLGALAGLSSCSTQQSFHLDWKCMFAKTHVSQRQSQCDPKKTTNRMVQNSFNKSRIGIFRQFVLSVAPIVVL